ncbi:hypothetical protein N7516_000132 [Penicillium verrucosum]|uniref:uncharacterized protein n=1 Tax=Penicillium verrucosum TaxID=60171 RepID=UPI0025451521|nr:uncharacterized protein N7516_000132 [Penicillium verrucosum]KAJ5939964.1 hypothetical protein N7516_000132 [Penicillium verrucosum]
MSYKLIFFFLSYFLLFGAVRRLLLDSSLDSLFFADVFLAALPVHREEKGKSVLELVRLAEGKGGAVMNSRHKPDGWLWSPFWPSRPSSSSFVSSSGSLTGMSCPSIAVPYPVQESMLKYNVAGFPRLVLTAQRGRFLFAFSALPPTRNDDMRAL